MEGPCRKHCAVRLLFVCSLLSLALPACCPPKVDGQGPRGYPYISYLLDPVSGFREPGKADQVVLAFGTQALGGSGYSSLVIFNDGTVALNRDGERGVSRLDPAQIKVLADEVAQHIQVLEPDPPDCMFHGQITVIGVRVGEKWIYRSRFPWFTAQFLTVAAQPMPQSVTDPSGTTTAPASTVESECIPPPPWHFSKAVAAVQEVMPKKTATPKPDHYRIVFWADDRSGPHKDFTWPAELPVPTLPAAEKCSAWSGAGCPIDVRPEHYKQITNLLKRMRSRNKFARTTIAGTRWVISIRPVFLGDREVTSLLWKKES